MAHRTALVVGATGAVAYRLVELLAAREGWQVIGLCRRPPERPGRVRYLVVDLLDAADARAKLAGCTEVTHVFYTARAAHGEGGDESVADNLAMLRNVMDAIEPFAEGLRHVHLVEGGKWYGLHLGPYRTPGQGGRSAPSATQFLLRPAGFPGWAPAGQELDVVRLAPERDLRLRARTRPQPGDDTRRLRRDLPRARRAARFSW
jgi:uncharacterized protein YbjT (DUF2867 family)